MFFKSLTIFNLKQQEFDLAALEAALPEHALKECGSQQEYSFGSIPLIRGSECWSVTQNGCTLLRFGKEEKVLPSSVVREALEEKVSDIELLEGRKVGRKEKADLKDELVFTLRPKAFSKRSDVWLYIDNKAQLVVFATTTANTIEHSFKLLQTIFGSFPMSPLLPQVNPSATMSNWLAHELPAILLTRDRVKLFDISIDRSKIEFESLEPLSHDVTQFIDQGMYVANLDLDYADKITFTLHDDLTIRKIKWNDLLKDQAFNDSDGGAASDLDASFAIASLTIRQLHESMTSWFALTVEEQDQDVE